ncbi:GMC family oxidoreductase [Corynebacterium terpenotabidum]|uniref:Choline dehydrogenase n=1 Tax=Corynebacterium terpenotabidum Y-11 TaxID=1200352 RepID=S4XGT0_9CORY|nr:GMC family oxidoreductase N-terminal domain-containing protein [Corynebacterium terpenotabidum]AGP30860.1 choline dehydrogenase [Corynebacterium terpenotabidum Y-11]
MRNSYDYIIVGAGSSGAVVAARLSEDPAVTVALIEAGPTDVDKPEILTLDQWPALLESGYDWDYPIEPQENGNSFMRHARAKVLGGCSSHNSCIAFHTPAQDLDYWVTLGADGWDSATVLPLLLRLEDNDRPGEHHGHGGPVPMRSVPPTDPVGVAVLEACAQEGLPTTPFNEGETVAHGADWFQISASEDGVRGSSSVSYLHPVLDRENLDILTDRQVSRIIFEGTRAVGVEYLADIFGRLATVRADKEVIVSAGAIDSPKLLMLSGIGPAEHLAEYGIDVLVDAPGVGSNLQDHPEAVISWESTVPMTRSATQWWEIGIFEMVDDGGANGLGLPDLMMHYGSMPFDMHTRRQGYPTADEAFCLTPNITHSKGRGTVRLRSSDFRDKPKVDPRYFTDEEGYDMHIAVEGIKLARRIVAQPAMAEFTGRELFPGEAVQSDEEIASYVSKTHNTVYHPAGTVRMGALDDAMSPLDPQLRVKGVDGLRVVDASVMPQLTAVNPNITCYLIGERAADLIRG